MNINNSEKKENEALEREEQANQNAVEVMKRQKRLSDAGSLIPKFDAAAFLEQHQKEEEQKKKSKSQSIGETQNLKNNLAEGGSRRLQEEAVNEVIKLLFIFL